MTHGQRRPPAVRRPEYTMLDHTGDIGVMLRARSRAALYEKAALVMFDILTDLSRVRCRDCARVEISSEDREDLMVRWLSELLFLHDSRRWVFGRFDVERIDETTLIASAWGESLNPIRHVVHTELKAVTYHQILVAEERGDWIARIIFDV